MLSKTGEKLKVGQMVAIWYEYDDPSLFLVHSFDRFGGVNHTHDTILISDLNGELWGIVAADICEIVADTTMNLTTSSGRG